MGPQIQLVGVQHIYFFAFHVEWMDPSIEQWRFTLCCWDGMSPWNNIKRKFCTHAKSLQHKQYVLNLQAYEKRAAFGVQPSLDDVYEFWNLQTKVPELTGRSTSIFQN
jgi:hypothetical protein